MWLKSLAAVLGLHIVMISPAGWAWSAKGHVAIAEAAWQTLPTREQKYFNALAMALLKNDAEQQSKILKNRQFKGLSSFASLAAWPDARRSPTLTTLFNRYAKTQVPTPLAAFAPFNTSRWHFVNQHYWRLDQARLLQPGQKGCKVKPYGDLAKVWRPLLASFALAKSDAERGLIVALLAHLLADAFQPLHTMASIDTRCKSDAGGNGYCLVVKNNGRCEQNLHQLWDSGFSAFSYPLTEVAPLNARAKVNIETLVDQAIAPMGAKAGQIYSLAKGREPSKAYRIKASALAREQSLAASHALAQLLTALYKANQDAR